MHSCRLPSLAAFILAGATLWPGTALAARIVRGPYLQAATPVSVVLRWRTEVPTSSVVEFGATADRLDRHATSDMPVTDHAVTLTRLAPNTRYFYAVRDGSVTLAGGAGEFVTTPPLPGTAQRLRFWVLGDPGTGDEKARAVRDAYERWSGGAPTDGCILLGDNAYPDGTDAEYQAGFFDVYDRMLRHTVLWPALGNHDSHSARSAGQEGVYFSIFTVPAGGEAGGIPSGTKAYYAFDQGNVHFVCLDTSDTSRAPDGPMLRWLRADLAATHQDWLVAFFHHPPYTHGNHSSDDAAGSHDLFEVRENILPVLEAGGIDLILAGHSHSYERSWLLDGYYGTSADWDAAKYLKAAGTGDAAPYHKPRGRVPHAGEVLVVAGSSGKVTPADKAPLDHPAMARSVREMGSAVVTVDGLRLEVSFVDLHGQVRDHFRIDKH